MDVHIDDLRRALDRVASPLADFTETTDTRPIRELTACPHTQTRAIYVRTRAGSNTSRLVKVGQLCKCGMAFIN